MAKLPERATGQVTGQVEIDDILNDKKYLERLEQLLQEATGQVAAQVVDFCREPRKSSEIMKLLGLKHWKSFQKNYLEPIN